MKVCIIDECNKGSLAKGMCQKHYERKKRTGSALLSPRIKICTMFGCESRVVAKKLCSKHYARKSRTGDPLIVRTNFDRPPNIKSLMIVFLKDIKLTKKHTAGSGREVAIRGDMATFGGITGTGKLIAFHIS